MGISSLSDLYRPATTQERTPAWILAEAMEAKPANGSSQVNIVSSFSVFRRVAARFVALLT